MLSMKKYKYESMIMPKANAAEAAVVKGVKVYIQQAALLNSWNRWIKVI